MKKLVSLLLIACLVLSLAACGAKAPAEEPAPAEKPAEAPAEQPAEEAPAAPDYSGITMSIVYNGDETWTDIIDNYAKDALAEAFPGLEFEFLENSGFDLALLSQTDDMPDIYYGAINTELLGVGVYHTLDELIDAAWLNANYSNIGFYTAPNGHIYALGSGSDAYYTGTWYYNVDVFDELGLSVPNSFDELLAVVSALKEAGYERPLCWCSAVQQQTFLQEALLMCASDPGVIDELCTNSTDFADQRVVDAFAKFQQLIDLDPFGKGNAELDEGGACAEFVAGNTPLLYTFSWDGSLLNDACTNFNAGVFMTPGGHCSGYGSFTTGWTITEDAESPEVAAEVLKVLLQCEAQRNHDNGIVTNFKVEGDVSFENQLIADRDVLYHAVENWHPWVMWNAFDFAGIISAVMTPVANFALEDVPYTMEDYRLTLQDYFANTNPFFEAYA